MCRNASILRDKKVTHKTDANIATKTYNKYNPTQS